jgi:hypothetical protein
MAQTNEVLLQGEKVNDRFISELVIGDGEVIVLHSGFGVEGVFSDSHMFQRKIESLRKFGAYREEPLSATRHEIDQVT